MNLIVRADGGPDIGYGHLVRTSAIASECSGLATYATTTPEEVYEVMDSDVEAVQLQSRDDPEEFMDLINTLAPDIVLADAYPVGTTYQRTVREQVPLAVLSDDTRHTICADVLINGNLYAEEAPYEFIGQLPEQLLGPTYVPLRARIRELAEREPPWREQPERALITMGGSDIPNLTPVALRAFAGELIRVDVIVGPGFDVEQRRSIERVADNIATDVKVAENPNDLPKRMFDADFAVCTASSTVYELLALGTPPISVAVTDNQVPIARALEQGDLGLVVGEHADVPAFEQYVSTYINNAKTRKRHRRLGRDTVDGKGTVRIKRALGSLIKQ